MPVRIQLRRAKGWRMPPNTVKVDRSTMWGNHVAKAFGAEDPAEAVALFRTWLEHEASWAWKGRARIELRGKNLACWCRLCERHKDGNPLGVACPDCAPCHVDPLLELANA